MLSIGNSITSIFVSVTDVRVLFGQIGLAITGAHRFKGVDTIFSRDPDRSVIELVERAGGGSVISGH